jgi:hypothetical protein
MRNPHIAPISTYVLRHIIYEQLCDFSSLENLTLNLQERQNADKKPFSAISVEEGFYGPCGDSKDNPCQPHT